MMIISKLISLMVALVLPACSSVSHPTSGCVEGTRTSLKKSFSVTLDDSQVVELEQLIRRVSASENMTFGMMQVKVPKQENYRPSYHLCNEGAYLIASPAFGPDEYGIHISQVEGAPEEASKSLIYDVRRWVELVGAR
jgi:hypothetical protein